MQSPRRQGRWKIHRKHRGGRKEGGIVWRAGGGKGASCGGLGGGGVGRAPLASSVDCRLSGPHREENQTLTEARSDRTFVGS